MKTQVFGLSLLSDKVKEAVTLAINASLSEVVRSTKVKLTGNDLIKIAENGQKSRIQRDTPKWAQNELIELAESILSGVSLGEMDAHLSGLSEIPEKFNKELHFSSLRLLDGASRTAHVYLLYKAGIISPQDIGQLSVSCTVYMIQDHDPEDVAVLQDIFHKRNFASRKASEKDRATAFMGGYIRDSDIPNWCLVHNKDKEVIKDHTQQWKATVYHAAQFGQWYLDGCPENGKFPQGRELIQPEEDILRGVISTSNSLPFEKMKPHIWAQYVAACWAHNIDGLRARLLRNQLNGFEPEKKGGTNNKDRILELATFIQAKVAFFAKFTDQDLAGLLGSK